MASRRNVLAVLMLGVMLVTFPSWGAQNPNIVIIYADDMGLGKTLQAIAAAKWLIEHSGVARVLVVCPASLKQQWSREIARFTGQTVQRCGLAAEFQHVA